MTRVCLVSVTPDAEKTIGYIARVSNPNNQDNPKVDKLLAYCIDHGHWSIFEQAHMTLEINTSRAIGCLLYTSPSPRDRTRSRMPSSA